MNGNEKAPLGDIVIDGQEDILQEVFSPETEPEERLVGLFERSASVPMPASQVPATRTSVDDMVIRAIESGNMDVVERMLKLRNDEEDRQAKKDFDFNFAQMQGNFETAKRVKKIEGKDWKYAPIEELQRVYGPVIARFGFSYRWEEEPWDAESKRVTMFISGYGHTRTNNFIVPKIDPVRNSSGKAVQNEIQIQGVMTTYGRRYTFISGFGVTVEDEDTDGVPGNIGDKYADQADYLMAAETIEELLIIFAKVWKELEGDREGKRYLAGVRDERKAFLEKSLGNSNG